MRTILTICLLLLSCAAYCQQATKEKDHSLPADAARDRKIAAVVKADLNHQSKSVIDTVYILTTSTASRKMMLQAMSNNEEVPQAMRDKAKKELPTADSVKQDYYLTMVSVHYSDNNGKEDIGMGMALLTKDLKLVFDFAVDTKHMNKH